MYFLDGEYTACMSYFVRGVLLWETVVYQCVVYVKKKEWSQEQSMKMISKRFSFSKAVVALFFIAVSYTHLDVYKRQVDKL